jgi:hypothetical protein
VYDAGAVDVNGHPIVTFAAATMSGDIVTLTTDVTYEVYIYPTFLTPHTAYVVLPILPVVTNAPPPAAWTAMTVTDIDCVYPVGGLATVTAESTDDPSPSVSLNIQLGAGPGDFSNMPVLEDTPWIFAGAVSVGSWAPEVTAITSSPIFGVSESMQSAFNDFLNYALGTVPMYLILNIGLLGTNPVPPPDTVSYHAEVTLDLSLFAYRVTWTG